MTTLLISPPSTPRRRPGAPARAGSTRQVEAVPLCPSWALRRYATRNENCVLRPSTCSGRPERPEGALADCRPNQTHQRISRTEFAPERVRGASKVSARISTAEAVTGQVRRPEKPDRERRRITIPSDSTDDVLKRDASASTVRRQETSSRQTRTYNLLRRCDAIVTSEGEDTADCLHISLRLIYRRRAPVNLLTRPCFRLRRAATVILCLRLDVMGPLEGLKVIEIAGIGPGPFAAMVLADMDADVLRIDRLSQADDVPMVGEVLNRGRPSVGIDLKSPKGVEAVLRLVESA